MDENSETAGGIARPIYCAENLPTKVVLNSWGFVVHTYANIRNIKNTKYHLCSKYWNSKTFNESNMESSS